MEGIRESLRSPRTRTRDLGGTAGTRDVTDALIGHLRR
jgi:isocitrate/isopropylmalate dehydrogenase